MKEKRGRIVVCSFLLRHLDSCPNGLRMQNGRRMADRKGYQVRSLRHMHPMSSNTMITINTVPRIPLGHSPSRGYEASSAKRADQQQNQNTGCRRSSSDLASLQFMESKELSARALT